MHPFLMQRDVDLYTFQAFPLKKGLPVKPFNKHNYDSKPNLSFHPPHLLECAQHCPVLSANPLGLE
jgi:hypothetical protein